MTTETKQCITCNEVKSIEKFELRKDTGKRRGSCYGCRINKDYMQRYLKAWKAANPDYQKQWNKNNPGYTRTYLANRKAAELGCEGLLTADDWPALLEFYGAKCMHPDCSNDELTIDHVVPLTLKGRNTLSNTQILCRGHNSSKGTKAIDYRDHSKGILVGMFGDEPMVLRTKVGVHR